MEARNEADKTLNLARVEANGLSLDADQIDLARGASNHRNEVTKEMLDRIREREANDLTNPEVYARKFKEANREYGYTAEEFATMVDKQKLLKKSGRKEEVDATQDLEIEDWDRPTQRASSKTQPKPPQRYATVVNDSGGVDKMPLTNFTNEGAPPGSKYRVVGFKPEGYESNEMEGTLENPEVMDLGEDM